MGGESSQEMSRGDFLRTFGLGAGAAGAAMLAGGQAFADMEDKGKYVFIITHGNDDPNRAILALLLAQVVAKKKWGEVHVWMTLAGADLAHGDKARNIRSPIFAKFGTAAEILDDLRERGASFGVCPPCAEYAGATGKDKPEWVAKAGGDWLMENIQGAWALWM